MRAAVVHSPGVVSVDEVPDPTPGAEEIVVRVDACGVCGTDLHIVDGEYPAAQLPITPGHEFAGTVVARGANVGSIAEGTFVAVDPVVPCGHCAECRAGWSNLCRNWRGYGVTMPGAFAEYVAVRAVDAQPLAPSIPRHWATLVEPLSCVLHAMDRMGPVRPGESVLVIGAGPTGLMLAQMLARTGGIVDVVERVPQRRERALGFGAGRIAADVDDLDQPEGWHLVVEASGSVGGFERGLRAVRRTGRFHVFGVAHPDAVAKLSPYQIFERELTITGSQSLRQTFGRASEVLAAGLLDGDAFVTDRIPLDDLATALERVRSGVGLKTQIVPTPQASG
jgi:2-desacetyl-2-hydroxyethyl bacteriochlorophyllide A dehydrogenase